MRYNSWKHVTLTTEPYACDVCQVERPPPMLAGPDGDSLICAECFMAMFPAFARAVRAKQPEHGPGECNVCDGLWATWDETPEV